MESQSAVKIVRTELKLKVFCLVFLFFLWHKNCSGRGKNLRKQNYSEEKGKVEP